MKKFFVVITVVFLLLTSLIVYKVIKDKEDKREIEGLVKESKSIEVNQKGIYKNEENNIESVEETPTYLIKSGEKFIEVYQIIDGKEKLIETTQISIEYLANEDINTLQNGIIVHSKEEIKKILEDYE
ncbi:hypothetical protein D3C87_1555480 [compost metagenome]